VISPQTMSTLKEWGQLLGYFVALPVAVAGLAKAVYEIGASRAQRAEELRWKRANAAKQLLDDIHNHELAKHAVHMLDWTKGAAIYEVSEGQKERISYDDVLRSLSKNQTENVEPKDVYIRDCFDWFFYRIDRIEHYIRRGLIEFEDVKDVFKVYAREIAKHEQVYKGFLEFHEYDSAREFFSRYKDQGIRDNESQIGP